MVHDGDVTWEIVSLKELTQGLEIKEIEEVEIAYFSNITTEDDIREV